ncbi:DUF1648 domain-containing protein [Streptomyces sp. BHT-5-2]|uniref:DUF1648 domain-containing protein n=1 Tax=unclassified Streptomyces TaxID=2593676 RepID=UPI001C8F0A87|nr:DUF1648 domain-containing protein [Streptomyces sp. BHT-5-2]QZL04641.1 DUF1648 domain-containing protein [Streptomyces sp. BHT-5-2]
MVFSRPVRLWLLPNAVLLAALPLWGILRYPHLPSRIPRHISTEGVDAWTERSIGSAFVLVFVYIGVTVLLTACAELTLRVTPQAELPKDAAPFGNGLARSSLNRPRTRASALRTARAVLVLNACAGVSLLIGCGVLWRSAADQRVSGWLFAAMLVPLLAGTAVTVAAPMRDRHTPVD